LTLKNRITAQTTMGNEPKITVVLTRAEAQANDSMRRASTL
jgi:hypothetical protein